MYSGWEKPGGLLPCKSSTEVFKRLRKILHDRSNILGAWVPAQGSGGGREFFAELFLGERGYFIERGDLETPQRIASTHGKPEIFNRNTGGFVVIVFRRLVCVCGINVENAFFISRL